MIHMSRISSCSCFRCFQSSTCTISSLQRPEYLPQIWAKHPPLLPGLATEPAHISSLLSAESSIVIGSGNLGSSKSSFSFKTEKRSRISNPSHGHSSRRSTRGRNDGHGKTASQLCLSVDRASSLSLGITVSWLECLRTGGMVLAEKGGVGYRRHGSRASDRRRAIPEDAFWITAGQAMLLPLLLVAVTVITSLAIRKRLENEAIEQMEEMEKYRKLSLLEQETTKQGEDYLVKENMDDDKVILARSRNRPIREE